LINVGLEVVTSLLVLVVADFVLTGHVLRVATRNLGEHNVGPLVVATVVLAHLALDIVVGEHRVVQCDARLRSMALALGFVRFVETCDLRLIIPAADVDDALVVRTELLSSSLYLDHTCICIVSHLDYWLANPTIQLILAISLAA